MQQSAIFSPLFAMLALTFVVWAYMYYKRIPFIQNSDTDLNNVSKTEFEALSPPHVANPSDNLKNLFELPVLFYALTLYLFTTSLVDSTYLVAAWIFVVFRILHSGMQCTKNIVMVRFGLYMCSSVALLFIALRAGFQHLGS